MVGLLDGKVAVVTGAGAGIGRSEALSLGAHGASVVVNDVRGADEVVARIRAAGGRAVANDADVSSWKANLGIVEQAMDEYGSLDVVVTNAGINRRNFIADVDEDEFDALTGVLLKGSYALIHQVAALWRGQYEAGSRTHRTVVATSSNAGVPGGVEEYSVYGAAKAGIAALAIGAAREFRRFGATANAILPHAATRMDAEAKGLSDVPDFAVDDPDVWNPQHVANVVSYLASDRAAWLSGQVFEITGPNVRRWVPWAPVAEVETPGLWGAEDLDLALATEVYGTIPGGRVIRKGIR